MTSVTKAYLELKAFLDNERGYMDYANGFRSSIGRMSLPEMVTFQDYNSRPLEIYRKALIICQYYLMAPIGRDCLQLHEIVLSVKNLNPSDLNLVKNLSVLYLAGLSKELSGIDDILETRPFLRVLSAFKAQGIEEPIFSQELNLYLSEKIMTIEINSLEDFDQTLDLLLETQELDIGLHRLAESFTESLLDAIVKKFISVTVHLELLEQILGLLKKISRLEIQEPTLKNTIKMLLFQSEIQYQSYFQENEKDFVQIVDITTPPLDLNQLTWVKQLEANSFSPIFDVENHLYTENGTLKVVRKMYKFKNSTKAEKILEQFIRSSDYLSSISQPNNCFLKYKGSNLVLGTGADICFEYYQETLFNKLTTFKAGGSSLTEDYIKHYCRKLANSLAIMESVHLFHQNINPYMIVVTETWEIKLLSSELSYIKNLDATAASEYPEFQNESMNHFRAPEVIESLKTGNWQRINRQKSDVFSFGLVMLFIYLHGLTAELNLKENHKKLMEITSEVTYPWLKEALKMTLKLKQYERCSFNEVSALLNM